MPAKPIRFRPTPEQIAQQQNQPGAPFVPGFQDHGKLDRFDTTPPGATLTPRGRSVTPVAFDPGTGMMIPPNSPPGFYPPGFVPGPEPGTMMLPQDPISIPTTDGWRPGPARPSLGPIPIPGYQAGGQTPPPGSVPGPDPGTYITPRPDLEYDMRDRTRYEPQTPLGPFPYDPGTNVQAGPQLPPGYPSNFGQNIPSFPSPPDPATVAAYHRNYSSSGPTIDPQQMYQYVRPEYGDPLPGGGSVRGMATGRQLATQRIRDSYMQNQLDPWIDQAAFWGLSDLAAGITPTPVSTPAVAAQPPSLSNLFQGVPAQPAGTEPGWDIRTAPLLDPANYPSGGGGGLFPGIGDILGDIGGALTGMIPQFGAPQSPPPPPFPMNSGAAGVPPMGGMPQGVGGQATIRPGPQFP